MRIRATLSAIALIAAGLAALPLGAAHADTGDSGVALPLASYYQMAVDSTHDHLFFSQGSASENGILVTDFSGSTVATITGQTGVMGIAMSPDGSTLYAALAGAHEVTAISTATLQQTAAYPLGDANTPQSVAVQSGKLWVSYDTGNVGMSAIGDFDLSAASPTLETQTGMGSWYSAPMIAADPAGTGNVLVAMQPNLDPASAKSYDTSADPVTIRASKFELMTGVSQGCDAVFDLAVAPGGAQFVPACDGDPKAPVRYSTADLSDQGTYEASSAPNSIAIASGTGLVAAGAVGATGNVYVYAPDGGDLLNTFSASGLADRGLGLTADGAELFAVGGASGSYTLYSYGNPGIRLSKTVPALSISVTPGSATYRPVAHITVHLGTTDGDRTVSVYAKTAGSTRQALLKTATVNSAGTLTLSFTAAYTTTFSAVFGGDADYAARTVTATTSVAAAVIIKTGGYYASKRIGSVTYRLYHRTKRLLAAAGVAPDKHGECVKFEVQELYKGKWYPSLTGCGKLGTQSVVGASFTLSHADLGYHYRVRADYERASDVSNLSADSAWQYFVVEK